MSKKTKETTVRMFCKTPTNTVKKGWYQVVLKKSSRQIWWDSFKKPKNVDSIKKADKVQLLNLVGNKVTISINNFSLFES